jgi:hypothetical protein
MYVRGYRLIEQSGNNSKVAIRYKGMLGSASDKKERKVNGSTWTAERDGIDVSKVDGAPLSPVLTAAWNAWTAWGTDTTGTETSVKARVTHGDIVIQDTWFDTGDPDAFYRYMGIQQPGSTAVNPNTYGAQVMPPTPPRNPWSSIPDKRLYWPYGWVLDGRSHESVGGGVGDLHMIKDRWVFRHKWNP